jgi:3-oxoacyl-[acyl-carrier protein] reductase
MAKGILHTMARIAGTAIVTGSTSGIGKCIAMRLLRAGYQVTLNYARDEDRADKALAVCEAISENALLVKADVSAVEGAQALVGRTIAEFGRLDVLINNAAVAIDRPILDMSQGEWDSVLNVNLRGAFLCSQMAARQMMMQDDGGVILNIGSSTGIRARKNGANTCASKAGLMLLTQSLALELAPKIRANTIIPGLVATDEAIKRFDLADPAVRKAREQAVPMQRLGTPDDVADAVLLMLTDQSQFITGQKIVVDGGQNMW